MSQRKRPSRAKWVRCHHCEGKGRIRVREAQPLTKDALAALSILHDPFCRGRSKCEAAQRHPEWRDTRNVSVDQAHEVIRGPYPYSTYDLRVCLGCGRLRRNKAAVSLRKAYRPSLEVLTPIDGASREERNG